MNAPSVEAVAASHAVMARHARSFRLASWFLAPHARDDAAILYAFCRAVDDAADDSPSREAALAALAALEAGLAREGDDVAGRVRALAHRRGMPIEAAFELIEGARSDLGGVRIESDAELLRYAYLVAGTVGSMMCSLLGARDERARVRAIDLGIAMQITNICRDVKEDAAMGRVYLPASRLARAGTSSADVLAARAPVTSVAAVVSDLLDLADLHYQSADVGARDLPPRARLAVLVASRVYRAIGVELRGRRCDPLRGRVVVPAAKKVGWTFAAALAWAELGLRRGGDDVPSPHGTRSA